MLLIENVNTKKILTVQSCPHIKDFAQKLKDYTGSPWTSPSLIKWLEFTHLNYKTVEVLDENFLYTFM